MAAHLPTISQMHSTQISHLSLQLLLLLLLLLLCPDESRGDATSRLLDQINQVGFVNVLDQAARPNVPKDLSNYDFIVVGAGAAGSSLAARLSENPQWSVALIEAGGVENIAHNTPVLAGYLQQTASNWGYRSVPQKLSCHGMNNHECSLPRGKVLGGTSSINYMIYNRGNRRDFDGWAAAGNPGWSYNDVLPYFLRTENAQLQGLEHSPYHNHSGPLSVEYVRYRSQMADAFVKASVESGLPRTDYNGESQFGVSYVQATTRNGRRHSAYAAYLKPVRDLRPNLQIFTFARVTRILIDEATKSAYGVEFHHKNKPYTFKVRKEVILSAGTFNSPQLLMLSGIGPEDNLKAIGVPLVQPLPVGKRMYDHMCHFGPTFVTNTTGQTTFTSTITIAEIVSHFLAGNPATRLSSIGGVEALAFLKTQRSKLPKDWPDIELIMVTGSLASDEGTGLKLGANFKQEIYDRMYRDLAQAQQDHFTLLVMQFHPQSVGRLWLRDRNPLSWPMIDPKYFVAEEDVEYLLDGIKASLRIIQMPAMQKIGARLLNRPVPGCETLQFASDDYWRCSIRTLSYTLHHQVATCRMGPESDPTTVVNHQLKVHGMRRLRVVDTSVIPMPPTAHTNAAAFMIGEKAADMIRSEWG
ncbi:glucose dehydrogenase [FAD, quinone] [Drosophila gunungcola]|uniref:glucose dehydrogenase [FAD, quinone] n=1 Tax=Drosophila gunungcola TaxID=103775 RepID=UPI0022E62D6A|nr:glucose dehydrogenase [FAD, quinone] [Drosophila gunungcola]